MFILEGKALVDGKRVASAEAKYRRPDPPKFPSDSHFVIPV
jgi:hypothetical protein